jgi:transglutaminase-like putative cysteine protease
VSGVGSVRLGLAAAVATLLAVVGLTPIVDGSAWIAPTVAAVLLVAVSGIALRAVRAPGWSVVAVQGLVLVLWVGRQVAAEQARLGWLPSRSWADQIADTAALGVDTVQSFAAPVPLDEGVLLLVVAGVGAVAWAVDALAVTARRAPLAGIPLVTVHGVAMATSPLGPSVWAFVATAVGYLGLLVVDSRERAAAWGRPLGSPTSAAASPGTRATSLAVVGIPLAAGALLLAVVGAGALPQGGWALVDGQGPGGDGDGGQTIRTENPIVDLKRDLVQPENVEVLRLTTDATVPEYLRLVTLDVYDGTVWRTADRPVPEQQRVDEGLPNPPGLSTTVQATPVQYEVEVTDALESQWLPLPYPAQAVTTASGDWRYDAETLDVVSTDRTTRGLRYDLTALDVQPSGEQLDTASAVPGRNEALLELPADLDPLVVDLAREVTAEATTDYERATALQQWFREDGGFTYDLSVAPGNAEDDLVAFLQDRAGYCEQYAASMAIMARVLGIPARVGVGYLRGEQTQPGLWVVRAQDAHAWPELYFEGVGWLRFEPTPSDRTGEAPAWTQQTTDEPTTPDGAAGGESAPTDAPGAGALAPLEEAAGAAGGVAARPSPWPLLAGVAVLLILLVLPGAAGLATRSRRWSRAGDDPVLQAEAAWADVRDAAWEAGFPTDDGSTVRVTAGRLARAADLPGDEAARLTSLARRTERARFAAAPPQADGLRDEAAALRHAFVRDRSRRTRWLARWWPAPARRVWNRLAGR